MSILIEPTTTLTTLLYVALLVIPVEHDEVVNCLCDPPHLMDDPRYNTKRWRDLKAAAHRRDNYHCITPGCQVDTTQKHKLHADHIVEAGDGGPFWDLNNIQTLCQIHHRAKTLDARARRPKTEPVSPNA